MACDSLLAFATATEDLDQRIRQVPTHSDVFLGAVPKGTWENNKGVEKTLYTMKASLPATDQPDMTAITLDDDNQPTPSCAPTYEDVSLGYYTRNYGPKTSPLLRGPEICRDKLNFIHNPDGFLTGYVNNLARYAKRYFEFALREDYLNFSDAFVDFTKYSGPNAFATLPIPTTDLTQDQLDLVADDLIDVGADQPDSNGYIMNGGEGPLFTLLVNRTRSANIVVNNADRRQDARYAIPNELWRRMNATRIIGNYRHVPMGDLPRANVVDGVLQRVNTYKSVADMSSNGSLFTTAYQNAQYEAAIVLIPQVMTAEVVTPNNWKFTDAANYMLEWSFVVGGERIDSGCLDPMHDRGRHFARLKYAAAPNFPYMGKVIWYKRCPILKNYAYCS